MRSLIHHHLQRLFIKPWRGVSLGRAQVLLFDNYSAAVQSLYSLSTILPKVISLGLNDSWSKFLLTFTSVTRRTDILFQ